MLYSDNYYEIDYDGKVIRKCDRGTVLLSRFVRTIEFLGR